MTLTQWQRPETAWPAWSELGDLRREMERLMGLSFPDFDRSQLFNEWAPAVDLYESKDHFTVKVEIPGMKREDIDVSLHAGALTVSGERKFEEKEDGANYRMERSYGRFQRTVTLPTDVQADKVKAAYKDGVLTIVLPKAEEAKPKQIEVNVQ